MQSSAVRKGFVLLFAAALAGCGGQGTPVSKKPSTVSQVTLTGPSGESSVSMVAGDVVPISASALNPSGGTVNPLPTFTFNSSNTSIATIGLLATGPAICAGAWDAFFIVCNGNDSQGNPIAGSALVTASAQGVTSAPIQVTVHPPLSSIVVDPVAGCHSIATTQQFTAHACSRAVTPPDTTGPCAPNAKEITSLVGPFTWVSTASGVASVDVNGLATAGSPGLTQIIASLGTVSSPGVPFRSCMPVQITLHINGDPAGQPTESATMNVADTRTIEADMVDELGVTTNSAPVVISSLNGTTAALSGTTLTADSAGGSGLVASCIPPACGVGLNTPVYSNLFSVTVNGSSPATFVYATTSFAPPSGTTPTIIPIDTSKSPIVAGTAINMPQNSSGVFAVPNSMIFAPGGAKAYLGTSAGIASLDTATNTVTLLAPFVGKALAVSPDGNTVIFSNAASAPDPITGVVGPIEPVGPAQRLVILHVASNTVESFVLPGAVDAAFTSDGFKAFIAVNNGNVYVFSPFLTLQTQLTLGGSNSSVATLASGPFAYFANSAGLEVMATCNNVQQPASNNPPTNSNTLQLLGATTNANLIVAVDSPGVDVETVALSPLTTTFPFILTPASCAPPVSYSNQFIDFGQGPFTAHQLLVPTNSAAHIVVLPVGISKVLVAVPGPSPSSAAINLAGAGTEALSGGMTLDGNTAWVGVAGTNSVDRIDLNAGSDNLQIATSFKKSDGSPAPPNIVAVKPK